MTSAEENSSLENTIQSLLLPISDERLGAATSAVVAIFDRKKIHSQEQVATLKREWQSWTIDGEPSDLLVTLVRTILRAEIRLPAKFVPNYFKTYNKLRRDRYLPPAQARSLLSNVLLIQDLLEAKRMSCTQIARVLSVTQSDHEFNWAMVQPVAQALGLLPKLNDQNCSAVYLDDIREEAKRFADASPLQAIDIVADIGDALGYDGSLHNDLHAFFADYKSGYGIMLHMGCLVLEFYDHPPKEAPYEFKPRGAIAKNLARQYHTGYAASESPYLNNAKGAANLDAAWAWARQPGYIASALAFAAILERLGSMPYPARKQLAPWIRQWLHRIAREKATSITPVTASTPVQIRQFLDGATEANTRTRGVLDQRIVDLLSSALHPNWEHRGMGDFVNASNVRKRKTGDIEFSNPRDGVIIAYEAHGGSLANVYVDLHRQTLRQVLRHRREELTLGRKPEDWSITINFIAHDLGKTSDFEELIDQFKIRWRFQTYRTFLTKTEAMVGFETLTENFSNLIVDQINNPYIPEEVRDRFRELSG